MGDHMAPFIQKSVASIFKKIESYDSKHLLMSVYLGYYFSLPVVHYPKYVQQSCMIMLFL